MHVSCPKNKISASPRLKDIRIMFSQGEKWCEDLQVKRSILKVFLKQVLL